VPGKFFQQYYPLALCTGVNAAAVAGKGRVNFVACHKGKSGKSEGDDYVGD
jgi:hypothetical protein